MATPGARFLLACRDAEMAAREAARRKLMADVAAAREEQLAMQRAQREAEQKQVWHASWRLLAAALPCPWR